MGLRRGMMGMASGGGSYLDTLAVTPVAALGLKKLISTATVAIRVRRGSDNAEQDIGFSGDNLDTAALASFIGANAGYVRTIYDQTGNGEDAVQTSASIQPLIVSAGTYLGEVRFEASKFTAMSIASLAMGGAYAGVYGSVRFPDPSVSGLLCELGAGGPGSVAQAFSVIVTSTSPNWALISSNAAGAVRRNNFDPASVASLSVVSCLFDRATTGTGEIRLLVGGSEQAISSSPNTDEQTGNYATADLFIGARSGGSLYMEGGIKSMAIYNSDTSALRASIEAIVA